MEGNSINPPNVGAFRGNKLFLLGFSKMLGVTALQKACGTNKSVLDFPCKVQVVALCAHTQVCVEGQ